MMVDHLTSVLPRPGLDAERVAALGAALADLGFEQNDGRGRTVWTSTTVEARPAKAHLRARGFADRDFQIVLEYVRRWGVM